MMSGIRYSDELIEEIRLNNDIVDVVSEYVKLEKRGKNYFGLCPFHREKTPSFSVESAKQIFYCFGCGKGGNVFQFITLVEKVDYMESVRFLAERAGIPLPEYGQEAAEMARVKKHVLDANLLAMKYYINNLRKFHAAAEYLKSRGITGQTAGKFGIGYSNDGWDNLAQYLKANGVSDEIMLKSGLVIKSRDGRTVDRFRGRIMFPIFDVRGNVVGFGGRVLDDALPKYMNSPETLVYNKRNHLYALNFAKNAGSGRLIVVEGYMDAISLHQEGICNVVASLGTSLTESQGRLLKKYAEEVIISYDSDMAGQAATLRGLDMLGGIGCPVRVLVIPDGKDPDEYIRKNGPDRFNKLVNDSLPLVEYKVRLLRSRYDLTTTEGKVAFLNKAADVLARIGNVIEREMYIKKFSGEYEISEEAMLSEILKRTRPAAGRVIKTETAIMAAKKRAVPGDAASVDEIGVKILHGEKFIISLLCIDNSIYKTVKEHFNVDRFTGEENRRVAEIVYARLDNGKEVSPPDLLALVNEADAGEYAGIFRNECYCDDNRKAILGKIKDMEMLKTEKKRRQVLERLKDKSALPEGDADRLMLELKNLTQRLKDIKDASK